MKLSIPKENADIRKAVQGKLIRQIVFCAIWVIAVSVFMIVYGYKYFADSITHGTSLLIWIIACLVPFYLCKSWRWFTDQPYEGTVTSCKQTSWIKAKGPRATTQVRMYTQNIRVRLQNGDEKLVKLSWESGKECPYYYEGDYIRYYRGTNFPQIISDEPGAHRICVMCGTSHHPRETECMICGKSLIDHTK